MDIVIKSVSPVEKVSKGKANWEQFTLEYRGSKGDASHNVKSFEAGAFRVLKDAEAGQTYSVNVVKDGEYWKWDSVSLKESQPQTGGQSVQPTTGKAKVGDWETSEERAKKQVYIVRQSSIDYAIKYCTLVGKQPTVLELLELANTFERHVFEAPTQAQKDTQTVRKPRAKVGDAGSVE